MDGNKFVTLCLCDETNTLACWLIVTFRVNK